MNPKPFCRTTALVAALLTTALAPSSVLAQTSPAPAPAAAARAIEINGRALDAKGQQVLRQVEARLGAPVPDGRYWYDPASGAAGVWGGPATAYVGPGLALGGPLPAAASGGGQGRLTAVFVNGRELHPLDVQGLAQVVPVVPGRYWWDPAGNVGHDGGPALFNFYALLAQAQQRAGSSGNFKHRTNSSRGESTYVGKGCAAVHGRLNSSDSSSSYSYYAGC